MIHLRPSIQTWLVSAVMVLSLLATAGAGALQANPLNERSAGLGTVKGVVRDIGGKPIVGALISIFHSDSLELFKQIKSATDGSFATRLVPGKYTIIAAANGFDSASFSSVEVTRSSELVYRFRLQPSGMGKTVPERRPDRKNSMWVIRSSQIRRSIYQHREDKASVPGDPRVADRSQESEPESDRRVAQSVFESYLGSFDGRNVEGINFATLKPISSDTEIVVAGQIGTGIGPMRIESELRTRPAINHQFRFGAAFTRFSPTEPSLENGLAQLSLQASDEWRVKDDVIIVLGVDYSRFVGRGNDFVFSPRLGVQFDVDSKTRIRGSYTTETQEGSLQGLADLEGSGLVFREPASLRDVHMINGRAVMNRSSRLELGVERILDGRSTLEANVFIDLTTSRGVGLVNIPIDFFPGSDKDFVANQQGRTQGVRVVYARRLSGRFNTSAGYAFGRGQKLNSDISDPSEMFQSDEFQSLFGQFGAEVLSGTNIRTVFRLSPRATVFAIDPFKGRLAIYDPSLSILVTQSLPSMGLPIRAEAVIDARNLLDYQAGAAGDEGAIRVLSQRRVLRGGIKVRF